MKIEAPACSDLPLWKEVESLQKTLAYLTHLEISKLKTVSGPHRHSTHYIIERKDRITSFSHQEKWDSFP